MDHKQRFMGWRKRMPERTRYLVDRVLEKLVPEFEGHGFIWYPDFKVGANVIPMQKRNGLLWPTVEVRFIPAGPFFKIEFSALPELCYGPQQKGIPRASASVVAGPLYMILHRGVWKNHRDSEFGFSFLHVLFFAPIRFARYKLDWRGFIDSEVRAAVDLLPYIFDIFERKTYLEWMDHPFGSINKHVYLSMSWNIRCDMESAQEDKSPIENEEVEIPQEPLLRALGEELNSINRKRDNKLLIVLLLAAAAIYFGEYFIGVNEWVGVALSVFCIGFIAYTVFSTARDKQKVAINYDLACARCGHKPDGHMLISAATSRHCARCGAWLEARVPPGHER